MTRRFVLGAAALLAVAGAAQADNVILNGGFETGDFTSWTANTLPGSNGSISVTNAAAGAALPHTGTALGGAAGPAGGSCGGLPVGLWQDQSGHAGTHA